MYLGRIVAIGLNQEGQSCAMYRVSSRSFPNRQAVLRDQQVSIIPRPGFEDDLQKNPYIAYNCLNLVNDYVVVSNGSHTDPIAEKIAMNVPVRDAMTMGLLAMDYEKDALDTPRIVAAIHAKSSVGFLGIVRKDAILVREFELSPGKAIYISTYEHNFPCEEHMDKNFNATCAEEVAQYAIDGGVFKKFENPVTSAAAISNGEFFELAAIAEA